MRVKVESNQLRVTVTQPGLAKVPSPRPTPAPQPPVDRSQAWKLDARQARGGLALTATIL